MMAVSGLPEKARRVPYDSPDPSVNSPDPSVLGTVDIVVGEGGEPAPPSERRAWHDSFIAPVGMRDGAEVHAEET
jgi:hypothetical protein